MQDAELFRSKGITIKVHRLSTTIVCIYFNKLTQLNILSCIKMKFSLIKAQLQYFSYGIRDVTEKFICYYTGSVSGE